MECGANMKGITFGTFDLLHIGHINILKRSRALCDFLIVGVSSDQLNFQKKSVFPVYNEQDRCDIIKELRSVDRVFLEHSLEEKRNYIIEHKADILIMGDDWKGKFDFCSDICKVVYLPRTPLISTTITKEKINNNI